VEIIRRISVLLATACGVVLVFVGGYLTASGSTSGLVLVAVGIAGFVVGRVFALPPRQRVERGFRGSRRAARAAAREARRSASVGGRSRRR
jgi:hypothetical protein